MADKTKVLIVVDMQNDFIDGALGTKEAVAIVPAAAEKIKEFAGATVICTLDTHKDNYLDTQEGRKLPVPHCIEGTKGWELNPEIAALTGNAEKIKKPTFGSTVLAHRLAQIDAERGIESITLIGLCTDICVIANAMMAKAALPEVPVYVDGGCCAGVSPESHERALKAMEVCQIGIV